MTEILCLLLYPALLCLSNPYRYFYLVPFVVLAWWVDFVLCHTFWAMAFGWPKHGEYTISDTLERLCREINNPDQELFLAIARKINRICPTHDHIKATK